MVTQHEYDQLCEKVWFHNRLYYVEHAPAISDEEFDRLLKKIEQIEKEHPDWISPLSPTQRVGEMLTTGFVTVSHRKPMLSLANTYSKSEVEDFIKRMNKLVEKKELEFVTDIKMDGIAISVTYEKGKFVKAVTRGDGKSGDEVSVNVKTIASLPLQIYGDIPEFMELRGEVFLNRNVFAKLNEQRASDGEAEWANPRNAAAGTLKLLNPKEVSKRNLSIAFYGIGEESSNLIKKQSEIIPFLKSLGLPVLEYSELCQNIDEIWNFIEKIKGLRHSLSYDIDGVVIKLNDLKEQTRLGVTGKNPRWAIAYKYAAEQAITRIINISVQVGRTGVLTPVADLQPVFLAGSTIARATLHNEEEVQRKDIRVGDTVIIEKGGDVIPKVVEVDFSKRDVTSEPWKMPEHCPSCGTAVVRASGEVAVRCPNEKECPEQKLRHLIYFAGKDAMDIAHLGEKVMAQLIEKKLVNSPSDIYRLTGEQLSLLSSFKAKSINNLLESIQKSKDVLLSKFIMSLSIKHVGAGMAETLALKAGSIQNLEKMTESDLMAIEGIGEKVAYSIFDYFSNPLHRKQIQELLDLGVTPRNVVVKVFHEHPFASKNFVLTGTLEKFTRTTAVTLIRERGGKITDSVSKKTDYIIAGADPGSKLEKGKTLGITILNESEFESML